MSERISPSVAYERWLAQINPPMPREVHVEKAFEAGYLAAVAEERERCAKVCEAAWHIDGQFSADDFAALVRQADA